MYYLRQADSCEKYSRLRCEGIERHDSEETYLGTTSIDDATYRCLNNTFQNVMFSVMSLLADTRSVESVILATPAGWYHGPRSPLRPSLHYRCFARFL